MASAISSATIVLEQRGSSFLRACGDPSIVREYNLRGDRAVIDAGVNQYPGQSNLELAWRPVWAGDRTLILPDKSRAPKNSDVDPANIDDIILEITHQAISISPDARTYTPSCSIRDL